MPRLVRLPIQVTAIVALGWGWIALETGRNTNADEPKKDERTAAIKPILARCTLELAGQSIKPSRKFESLDRNEYRVGERRIVVEKDKVSGYLPNNDKAVWTAKSAGGHRLHWLTADDRFAYLRPYQVGEDGHFTGYVAPPSVLRLDLAKGEWSEPLPASVAKDKTLKPADILKVLASDGYVVLLTSMIGTGKDGEAGVSAFEITCFRPGSITPIWSKSIASVGSRPGPGAYLLAATRPDYAESNLQHLSWMGDALLVCAEAVQPMLCLNRDTGTQLWQVDRPWEFERGFIGPSVWQHYIGRFGRDEFRHDPKQVAKAREQFDKQFDCAVIGGPVALPLSVKRWGDSHSIFVAVSKGNKGGFSGYTADCILYEFNNRAEPVGMLKLPQMVRGGALQRQNDGVVWYGQNGTFFKVQSCPDSGGITMGPGGPDCLLRMPWLRQVSQLRLQGWLVAGKAGDPVAFTETHAFCVPSGGYLTHEDHSTYHFPITALDLRSGAETQVSLKVPFDGSIREPSTNCSKTTLPDGRTQTACLGPYMLAITRLRAEKSFLVITLGMEKWAADLQFDLSKIDGFRAERAAEQKQNEIQAWVKALGDVNKADEDGNTPLQNAAESADARYVQTLLKAGADPKIASKVGWTPLMVAACYGTAEAVQLLIDAGSDVNARDKNCGGQTVIMWAARSSLESKRKVQALLKAGADPKAVHENGWNALMSAANDGNLDTVELLLASEMDVTTRSNGGETVLMWAADGSSNSAPEIVRALLKAGADIKAKDKKGQSVLVYAANGSGGAETMQVLLDAGADPMAKDAKGRSVLEILKKSNRGGAKERLEVLEKFLNRK